VKPELGREYPELDDRDVFERMVAITIGQMQMVDGHLRRGQHAKPTGNVRAEFRVADDIPVGLRHGIFANPGKTFTAIVRFSNSQNTFEKDSVGTARGLAIKLLDVVGTRAIPGDGDTTQDFLMVDHPVFPFPNPTAYFETLSRAQVPFIGKVLAGTHLALLERDELRIIKDIRAKHVATPLGVRYWSGSPFWLGPASGNDGHAVKYSAIPRQVSAATPQDEDRDTSDDFLSQAIIDGLRSQPAWFDFTVQLQTDAVKMPVEDVSEEWSEELSHPLVVASLYIAPQRVDSSGRFAQDCERLSFNLWHALAEHRPLGGMNRLRRVIYQVSVDKRRETDATDVER
jgi:hypothetical protein